MREIKRTGKFERVGLSLHYGRQGLDVYAIRKTPQGMTLHRFEVKSSNNPNAGKTAASVLALLKVDKGWLQQGSRLYGEDRLNKALSMNCKTAAYIRSKQVMSGRGRCWQARDYVCFVNTATGQITFWKPVQNKMHNKVVRLEKMDI